MKAVNDSPVASLLPDEMVSGGLADDFDGVVREARYAPWDYNGHIDRPVLSIRLKIERLEQGLDEDEKMVEAMYSAGALDQFRPSIDSLTPTPGEGMEIEPGYVAIRVGTKTALNNNTNAAQLMRSLLDAKVDRAAFRPDVRFMEGIKGHWNRLPPDKKGGQFKDQTPEQANKKREVLVLTRFDGMDTATKTATTTAKAASAGTNGSTASSIDAQLVEIVKANLKPGGDPVKKTALSGIVLKAMKGNKDANKAVKRVTETEFLENLTEANILFDAEAGTVQAIEV